MAGPAVPKPTDQEIWLLKHRLDDLETMFRKCWDLYLKFYTVFITFSLTAMGLVISLADNPTTRKVLAAMFIGHCLLTAITSTGLALYSIRVSVDHDLLASALLSSTPPSALTETKAMPIIKLAKWAGTANTISMFIMIGAWVYIGFFL